MRGVVFDLDGTLADTLRTIAAAVNHGLGVLGLPPRSLEEVAEMVGEGVAILCEKALPPDRVAEAEELARHVRAFYERHPVLHCRLFPGMEEALGELRALGLRLGVLSNKPDSLTQKTIDGLGVRDAFAAVLGHREDLPRKPDPAGLHHVLGRLGLSPDEILYVGDTPIDMETGARAGAPRVAVAWGFRPLDVLVRHEPEYVAREPADLVAIVRRRLAR